MVAYQSLVNIYRAFCRPTSFAAETRGMHFRQRLRFMLLTAPLMLASAAVTVGSLSLVLQVMGWPFHWAPKGAWWFPALLGVATGVVWGAAWRVSAGVAWGVWWGPAQWLIASVVLPLVPSMPPEMVSVMSRGMSVCIALGVALGATVGTEQGPVWGVVLGAAFGVVVAPVGGVVAALAFMAAFLIGYFGLEWYALDAEVTLVQLLRARRSPAQARGLLRASPIYWREPIWVPLLGLKPFLLLVGESDYDAGVAECLFVISERPTQARAARTALVEMMARRLARFESVREIASAADEVGKARVEGARLPAVLDEALPGLEELARHAEQHLTATLPHNRRRALERMQQRADEVARKLALERGPLAGMLLAVARKWREVADARLQQEGEAEEAAGFVHNPFVFGQPIEETETNLFVGRRDVVRQIEMSLLGGTAKPALVLWGPRRMGKTSVLLQLPRLLGTEFVPAFIDMQSMQARESLPALFRTITGAASAALRRRGLGVAALSLSDLEGSPFNTFGDWMSGLEQVLGEKRYLLLCLDEFERLETSIREEKLPKELMDQIRHIIQHHPRVVVMVSGSHRPDEMELNWPDVLISTRLIEVSYLGEEETRQLIMQPVPDFRLTYGPGTVEQVAEVTRGQPYLVQAVCFELVNHLNEAGRQEARGEDVEAVVEHALDSTRLYFAEMWRQLSESQQGMLRALAGATAGMETGELARVTGTAAEQAEAELGPLATRRILERDGGRWSFEVPMVARWVGTRSG